MKLYQIQHSNMDSTGCVNNWAGKIFVNEENAKKYVNEYTKLLLPFEEVYGIDMCNYQKAYEEAVDVVSSDTILEGFDAMELEVFRHLAFKFNKTIEEIRVMDDSYEANSTDEEIPTIKEIETED